MSRQARLPGVEGEVEGTLGLSPLQGRLTPRVALLHRSEGDAVRMVAVPSDRDRARGAHVLGVVFALRDVTGPHAADRLARDVGRAARERVTPRVGRSHVDRRSVASSVVVVKAVLLFTSRNDWHFIHDNLPFFTGAVG